MERSIFGQFCPGRGLKCDPNHFGHGNIMGQDILEKNGGVGVAGG